MSLPQEIVQTIETFAFEAPLTSLVRKVAERGLHYELTMTFRLAEFRDPESVLPPGEPEEPNWSVDDLEPAEPANLEQEIEITAMVGLRGNGMEYINIFSDEQDFCSNPVPEINAHVPFEHWIGEALKGVLIDPVKSLEAQLGPTRFAVNQALSGLGLGVISKPDESTAGILSGLDEKTTALLEPLVEYAIEHHQASLIDQLDTWEHNVACPSWPFTIATIQEAARMAPEQVYERIVLGLQKDGLMMSNGKFQRPMAFFKAMQYLGVEERRLACLHETIEHIATLETIVRQRRDVVNQAAVIVRLEARREQSFGDWKRLRNEVTINRVTISELHTSMKDLAS